MKEKECHICGRKTLSIAKHMEYMHFGSTRIIIKSDILELEQAIERMRIAKSFEEFIDA